MEDRVIGTKPAALCWVEKLSLDVLTSTEDVQGERVGPKVVSSIFMYIYVFTIYISSERSRVRMDNL